MRRWQNSRRSRQHFQSSISLLQLAFNSLLFAREFSTASAVSTAARRFSALATPILILLTVCLMTQEQLIKLHDHLVAHYNAHGAEEAREQICALEEMLLASMAGGSSRAFLPTR
jgi:hypothetical protein